MEVCLRLHPQLQHLYWLYLGSSSSPATSLLWVLCVSLLLLFLDFYFHLSYPGEASRCVERPDRSRSAIHKYSLKKQARVDRYPANNDATSSKATDKEKRV